MGAGAYRMRECPLEMGARAGLQSMTVPPIRLASGGASAAIAPLGAEPQSWKINGRELLWSADPAFWPQTSPILFPLVGWTRNNEMRIKGKTYPLGLHGFAAREAFELLHAASDRASLRLTDNGATRELYPFAFELSVDYTLTESAFDAAFTVRNPGDEPLPYALGLHPGFVWPLGDAAPEAHRIVFSSKVSPLVPVIVPGGLFSTRRRELTLEAGRALKLSPALFVREAQVFLDAPPRLLYENGKGQAIEVLAEDFPHVALWTRPGAPYLCIESWTCHGDPEGFTGDIFQKPSMRVLAPGASARHRVTYIWHSGLGDAGGEAIS